MTMAEHCRNMHPAVKETYKYIIQEMGRIDDAIRPLREHLKYLQEIGALDIDKTSLPRNTHKKKWVQITLS